MEIVRFFPFFLGPQDENWFPLYNAQRIGGLPLLALIVNPIVTWSILGQFNQKT